MSKVDQNVRAGTHTSSGAKLKVEVGFEGSWGWDRALELLWVLRVKRIRLSWSYC